MALDVIHLRFALDVQDDYDVSDLSRYLSGTIYPDTRYVTGIDRVLTHPKAFDDIPLPKEDDFRKGWESHLVYDDLQAEASASVTGVSADSVRPASEDWKRITAFKILQAEYDFRSLDVDTASGALKVVLTPFGESEIVVGRAFEYVRAFLRGHRGEIRVRSLPLFRLRGEDSGMSEMADELQARCDAIRKDPELMRRIAGMYDETMRMYHKRYR